MYRRRLFSVLLLTQLITSGSLAAQSEFRGIPPEHRGYELAPGVTSSDVYFYSDGVLCWARLFFPADFSPQGRTPGVVLAQGWTETADTVLKFAARFAERGLVAMAFDYRGWGRSDGFVSLLERVETDDETRHLDARAEVRVTRTRLVPSKQVEDLRNAISYLQGEPGVDRERIGLWGASWGASHVIMAASIDTRPRALVLQVPDIGGYMGREEAIPLSEEQLEDAIGRARHGEGGEFLTGFSQKRHVDYETVQLAQEYLPMGRVRLIPESVPVLLQLAGNDELYNNDLVGKRAFDIVRGEKKLIEYPGIGHFDIYIKEPFEQASNDAAAWFLEHLKQPEE